MRKKSAKKTVAERKSERELVELRKIVDLIRTRAYIPAGQRLESFYIETKDGAIYTLVVPAELASTLTATFDKARNAEQKIAALEREMVIIRTALSAHATALVAAEARVVKAALKKRKQPPRRRRKR